MQPAVRASYDKAAHLHHRLPGTAFDEAFRVGSEV
jgi:hypothetical protein